MSSLDSRSSRVWNVSEERGGPLSRKVDARSPRVSEEQTLRRHGSAAMDHGVPFIDCGRFGTVWGPVVGFYAVAGE